MLFLRKILHFKWGLCQNPVDIHVLGLLPICTGFCERGKGRSDSEIYSTISCVNTSTSIHFISREKDPKAKISLQILVLSNNARIEISSNGETKVRAHLGTGH